MITFKLSIISKLHASIYANIFKFSREQFPQNDFSEIKTNHYVCSQLLSEKLLLKTRWDTKSKLRIFLDFIKYFYTCNKSLLLKKRYNIDVSQLILTIYPDTFLGLCILSRRSLPEGSNTVELVINFIMLIIIMI